MGSVVNICKQGQVAGCFQPCAFTSSGGSVESPCMALDVPVPTAGVSLG